MRLRKRPSKRQETDNAKSLESILLYLECSDYKPPVREFLPMLDWILHPLRAAFRAACEAGSSLPARSIGVVYGGHIGERFCVEVCRPVARTSIHRLASWVGTHRLNVPADANYCRLLRARIYSDGRIWESLPEYYYMPANGGGLMGWTNVIRQTSTRTTRRVSGSGENASYAEFAVESSSDGGFAPSFANALPVLLRGCWSIQINAENGKSHLIVPTDPDGVAGFYNLRAAPMAGGRRAALLHWVKSHSRRLKTNQDTVIKGHFRGVDEFDWFGLRCRIRPPTAMLTTATSSPIFTH